MKAPAKKPVSGAPTMEPARRGCGAPHQPCDDVGDGVREPDGVPLDVRVPEAEPVAVGVIDAVAVRLGDAPRVSDDVEDPVTLPVGVRLKTVPLGVTLGLAESEPVGDAVPDDEPVDVAVTLGDAPRVSDEVALAVRVGDADDEGDGSVSRHEKLYDSGARMGAPTAMYGATTTQNVFR